MGPPDPGVEDPAARRAPQGPPPAGSGAGPELGRAELVPPSELVRAELVLGPLAQRLEPRALLAGRLPACHGEGPARLALVAEALPAPDRARLAGEPGVRLLAGPGGMSELRVEEPALLARLGAEAAAEGLAGLAVLAETWRLATRPPARPRVMGIVNVTPDSFSDGGLTLEPARAIEHGLELEALGADLLDVGGESTRPGSEGVPAEVELARVLPVVEGLAARARVPISIDTTKAAVARAALDAGATLVNDVSAATFDPGMLELVARRGAGIVLMHLRGRPRDMQRDPRYDDVVREVLAWLRERAALGWKAGVPIPRITVDPGIGFGKRPEDNVALVRAVPELRGLGLSVLLGVSRKSFLVRITGPARSPSGAASRAPSGAPRPAEERPAERIGETAAAVAACTLLGADVLRVHDVGLMAPLTRVARALGGDPPGGG